MNDSSSREAWDVAKATGYANSIPEDVAQAAIQYSDSVFDSLNTIATIKPVSEDGVGINGDAAYTAYQVGESGAVMCDDRGCLAIPVGHVQKVIGAVVRETDYLVTSVMDSEHLDLAAIVEGEDSE